MHSKHMNVLFMQDICKCHLLESKQFIMLYKSSETNNGMRRHAKALDAFKHYAYLNVITI